MQPDRHPLMYRFAQSVRIPVANLVSALLLAMAMNLSAADTDRITVVQPGDTWSTIADREFRSTGLGRLIAEHNKVPYEDELKQGQKLSIPVAPDPQYESAEVVFSKGDAFVLIRGNEKHQRLLQSGNRVFATDLIKTDTSGFVSLQFPTGTVVNIQPSSLVGLTNVDCIATRDECVVEMDALEGNVANRVRSRDGQPSRFNVTTPHASAAVRGTVFDIDASTAKLLVGVTEGLVDIQAQGGQTELEEGQGAKTEAGQPPSEPVALLVAPSIQRYAPRISDQDVLSWYSMDRAQQYLVTINQDAQGVSTVYSAAQAGTLHRLRSLEPGVHYAAIRAVDGEGFRGFTETAEFNSVKRDTSVDGLTLAQDRDNDGIFITAPEFTDEDGIFEIQLAFNPDFSDVATVDVPTDGGMMFEPVGIKAYVRARKLVDDSTVGNFGPVLELPAE